jgi:hypothetical protein
MEMTTDENGTPCWIDLRTTGRAKAGPTGGVFSAITTAGA